MMKKIFGVDIGGTTVKIGYFNEDGTLISKCEIPSRKEEDGKYILSDIVEKLDEILEKDDLSRSDCKGIGVGLPGPVTPDGRILGCVNLGWGTFNIEEKFSQMFSGIFVKAGNDANLAALGEQRFGGGKGYNTLVMITLGTGVGGGVIIDGKILSGTNGAAGELGHITVEPNEKETCGCGRCGCLEQYSSASGIVRLAKQALQSDKQTLLRNIDTITAKDVMDLAKAGDEVSLEVINKLGKYLGMALTATANIVNPNCMIIGGGFSKAG